MDSKSKDRIDNAEAKDGSIRNKKTGSGTMAASDDPEISGDADPDTEPGADDSMMDADDDTNENATSLSGDPSRHPETEKEAADLKPEEKYERRRLARIKGREDALFSVILTEAVLSEIDMDLEDDEDEEDKFERGVGPDAPSLGVQCVIRCCCPRPMGPEVSDSDSHSDSD